MTTTIRVTLDELRLRGFDLTEHIDALKKEDVDQIALSSPTNWMTEDEVESGMIPVILKEMADHIQWVRSNLGDVLRSSGQRFQAGQIVMTPGALDLAVKGADLLTCMIRHLSGDWGDLCDSDKQANDKGLEATSVTRLLSAYETEHGKIWIITEIDRSATTILLPEEY